LPPPPPGLLSPQMITNTSNSALTNITLNNNNNTLNGSVTSNSVDSATGGQNGGLNSFGRRLFLFSWIAPKAEPKVETKPAPPAVQPPGSSPSFQPPGSSPPPEEESPPPEIIDNVDLQVDPPPAVIVVDLTPAPTIDANGINNTTLNNSCSMYCTTADDGRCDGLLRPSGVPGSGLAATPPTPCNVLTGECCTGEGVTAICWPDGYPWDPTAFPFPVPPAIGKGTCIASNAAPVI